MNTKIKASVVATVLLMVLFTFDSNIRGQEPPPSPSRSPSDAATDKAKSDAAKDKAAESGAKAESRTPDQPEANAKPPQAAATVAKPAPASEDFLHQEEMTGNWGGARSRLKERGFEAELSLTQFFQGVASGGVRTGSEYNGTFQTLFKFDFGKMFGWKFWSAEIKTETRFGGPLLGGTGAINPVNTSAIIPGSTGTLFSVTSVNLTKLFPINLQEGKLIALSFGRYNLVDLLDEDFFAGGGTERFLNIAPIGPLTVLRQVPLITNAVSFAYIRKGEPFITFALLDPNDYSLEPGLAELFEDGVTFSPGINFPVKYFGKTAKHSIGGAITTKAYTPFDSIRQALIPGPPINPIEPQRGSWSISYTFRQYLVERGKRDGWGLFSQVSFADKNTSPITVFFNVGLGGNGLFKRRSGDEFGVSYAYTDLSEVLKDNIDLLPLGGRRLLPEHQVEMFYNLHITPWLRVTGDLQVIRPTRPIAETAIVPGVRLKMIF
jgi:porin